MIRNRIMGVIKRLLRRKTIVYANISVLGEKDLLANKVALITGGSSGFGYAIARRFLECGASVIITGRNEAKLNKALERLNSEHVKGLVWDISNTSLATSKYQEASSFFGPIDIAVNNAGVWMPQSWKDITSDEWDKIVDTNLKGLFFICQTEASVMALDTSKVHKIINITSIEGIRSGFGSYSASKWGANGLSRGMAKELTGKNIIVNAIAPGMGLTDINPKLPKDGNLSLNNLNGRYVTVDEVAELALFLASSASNSIVGQVIAIDGGMSLN